VTETKMFGGARVPDRREHGRGRERQGRADGPRGSRGDRPARRQAACVADGDARSRDAGLATGGRGWRADEASARAVGEARRYGTHGRCRRKR
jgi:hypothetical protein